MILSEDSVSGIQSLTDGSIRLLWTDPPFGTGKRQLLQSTSGTSYSYLDYQSEDAISLVVDTIRAAIPKLAADATVAICLDYRIVHEVKVELSKLLHFEHEIIYHFELGAVARNWWTNKHNTILLFSKGQPVFNKDQVPRVRRKSKRGSYASDTRQVNSVWSITMGPSSPERTGWPNQKPVALVEPFVLVHTNPGDLVVDPFAGSGTVGVAALMNARDYVMIDVSPDAVSVMRQRGLT